MARRHGQVLVAIWADPDWVALSSGAQRLYMLLLSQPKLSIVGMIDRLPSRWARLSADTTLASVEDHLDELEASRFVLVDHDTDEVLIRTLVRHDLDPSRLSRPTLKGIWNAWQQIQSLPLRLEVIHNLPEMVWETARCQPHPDAVQMRRSPPLKREPPSPSEREVQPPSESPVTSHLSPDVLKQSSTTPSNGMSTGGAAANPGPEVEPAYTAEARTERLGEAVDLLVTRELERNPTRNGNTSGHARAVRNGKLADHNQAGHRHLAEHPDLRPAELADLLEPPPAPNGSTRHDPTAGQRAAAQRRAETDMARNAEVLATPTADAAHVRAWLSEARAAVPGGRARPHAASAAVPGEAST